MDGLERKPLTVVDSSHRVQTSARPHNHNRSSFSLEVMRSQRDSVDDTVKVDVHGIRAWGQQFAIAINSKVQVVGAGTNTSIGENVVDSSMLVFCGFEKFGEVGPLPHVGLHEKEVTLCWWALNVAADNVCAEGQKQLHCGETNA
jgi:hypothetical protein